MQERDSLQRVINEKDLELNDIMGTFNEVQEGIRRINEAEGRVVVANSNPESAGSREVIHENMDFIQKALEQNRDMINQLKGKLSASTIKSDKLGKTIENLQTQIEAQALRIQELEASLAEKEARIAEQDKTISELNENVSSLTTDNKEKARTLSVQEKELNTAWFVFGTKSELKEEKILADGDVLRDGDFNKDYFTKIDIRYDKVIKLYSKSAKILSSHPSGSYKMVKNGEGQYELHITTPAQFWGVTKYLVIQVK